MPFTKETAKSAGKKGGQAGKFDGVGEYLSYLASGAARHYYTKLEQQAVGVELSEPEREFMNRFERNTEFIAPKLARNENSHNLSEESAQMLEIYARIQQRKIDSDPSGS